MSENNYECVGSPSYSSIAPSTLPIANLSTPFSNFSPISERKNYSTQDNPTQTPPPIQTITSSLPQIINLSHISEIVNPKI